METGHWLCERYDRLGARCLHRTDNEDRWCRLKGCDGFARARADVAPDLKASMFGTDKHVAATGHLPVGLDLEDLDEVRISQRAVDSFRYHHGGSEDSATSQLLAMLEDFLIRSARRTQGDGYVLLARKGYALVLSPDRQVVVSYSTAHRERTWEQVRSGVRSRFGRH